MLAIIISRAGLLLGDAILQREEQFKAVEFFAAVLMSCHGFRKLTQIRKIYLFS